MAKYPSQVYEVDCIECGDRLIVEVVVMSDIDPRTNDMILRAHIVGSPVADHMVTKHRELID